MKFRTDFVTNSSSSCYITEYWVQGIRFQPLPDDYTGEMSVSYAYVSIEEVIEKIKNGASVDEIVTMFAESTNNDDCLHQMFSEELQDKIWHSDLPYEEMLEKISKREFEGADEDDAYRAEDYLKRIRSFREAMSQFSSASEIKKISVINTYTGWGEFLSESIESFVDRLDSKTKELAEELLDDFWWNELEEAVEQTTYSVTDGKVTKTKQGFADTRDYILDMYWDRFDSLKIDEIEDEMPKLEYIATEVKGESSLPTIIDAMLNKGAAEFAEQFLDKMTAVGGKHAEVAERLKVQVADAKAGRWKDKSFKLDKYVNPHLLFLSAVSSLATALRTKTESPDGYELLTRAIAAGSAEAINMQGVLYGGAVKMTEALGQTIEKDYVKARACFEKALEIKPDLEIAKNNLKKLADVEEAERTGRETDKTLKWIVMQKRPKT